MFCDPDPVCQGTAVEAHRLRLQRRRRKRQRKAAGSLVAPLPREDPSKGSPSPSCNHQTLSSFGRTFPLYDQVNLIDNIPEDQLRFQVPRAIIQVIGSLWVLLSALEEKELNRIAVLSSSVGFVSLLIGELGVLLQIPVFITTITLVDNMSRAS